MRLKCGATAWAARPRHLSTHLQIASRAVYKPRFAALAICGPRILRPTRLMTSQPRSFLSSHNLVLSGRVKTVHSHLLCFLTLIFNNKVKKNSQYILHLLFPETALTHWGSVTHICADHLCHLCIDMFVVRLEPCHYLNQCWHTVTSTNFGEIPLPPPKKKIIIIISYSLKKGFWK